MVPPYTFVLLSFSRRMLSSFGRRRVCGESIPDFWKMVQRTFFPLECLDAGDTGSASPRLPSSSSTFGAVALAAPAQQAGGRNCRALPERDPGRVSLSVCLSVRPSPPCAGRGGASRGSAHDAVLLRLPAGGWGCSAQRKRIPQTSPSRPFPTPAAARANGIFPWFLRC